MLESERVKILVVGDSGVGKTALVHLICTQTPLPNPSFTVGCSLEVKVHMFRAEPTLDRPFFVELWDIGGSNAHANTRAIFYQNLHGVILVYDCTNRKSQLHLRNWLNEVVQNAPNNNFDVLHNGNSASGLSKVSNLFSYFSSQDDLSSGVRLRNPDRHDDGDSFSSMDQSSSSSSRLPVLVVGTKLDGLDKSARRRLARRPQPEDSIGRWSSSTSSHINQLSTHHSWNGSPPDLAHSASSSRGDSVVVSLSPAAMSSRVGSDKQLAFAAENEFPEILLCCNNPEDLAPSTSNAMVLNKFFDDVILNKLGGTSIGSHSPDTMRTRRAQPLSNAEPPVRIGSLLSMDNARITNRMNWYSWYVRTSPSWGCSLWSVAR